MLERWLASCPALGRLIPAVAAGRPQRPFIQHDGRYVYILAPAHEKRLIDALRLLVEGSPGAAAAIAQEASAGVSLGDLLLLHGALCLADGRVDAALPALALTYDLCQPESHGTAPGLGIRRLCPSLRLLARASPAVLLPLYANEYGAGVLYALCLQYAGRSAEALDVLRELAAAFGLNDELRLLAGQLHLLRGDPDKALELLGDGEGARPDGVEFARQFHSGLAQLRLGSNDLAIRSLQAALALQRDVCEGMACRARVLLAEAYARQGLLHQALRESGRISAAELPHYMRAWLLERETQWVAQLAALPPQEIERLAQSTPYRLAEKVSHGGLVDKLSIVRDPLKALVPKAASWLQRREEERQIAEVHAAIARGEEVVVEEFMLSDDGKAIQREIQRSAERLEQRAVEFAEAPEDAGAALDAVQQPALLAFDWRGKRPAPGVRLAGELRLAVLSSILTLAALSIAVMALLRSCVY